MPIHKTYIVRNRSSRGGVPPVRVVLHTTEGHEREGASDVYGIAGYFDNSASQASSHRVVDGEGNSLILVPDAEKAWTQAAFNPTSLSIEQVGFSAYNTNNWIRDYHNGLRYVAGCLVQWHEKYGIRLRHSVSNGICQHKDLGAAGGGHHDCGDFYPERYVTYWARYLFHAKHGHKVRAAAYKKFVESVQRRHGVKHPTVRYR